jgi:hypothetical protein
MVKPHKTRFAWLVTVVALVTSASCALPNASETQPASPVTTPLEQAPESTSETMLTPTPPPKPLPRPLPPPPRPTPAMPTSAPTPTPPPTPTPTPPPSSTPATLSSNLSISTWTEWGIASFGKEYPATPGTMLNFVKVGEGTSPDGKPTIIFRPVAVGLSGDKVYYLWYKALRQSSPAQLTPLEMSIADGGYVIPNGRSTPMSISCYSFSKGEARVFALMTEDKSIIAYGKVILYPIQAKQDSRRIWVELAATTGNLFIIYGEGFEPNEELNVTSNSTGEVVEYKGNANDNGRFTNVLLPAVAGKQSGLVTYTVVGKAGTLTVSFEWGPPALLPGP